MAQQTAVEWLIIWYSNGQKATIKECFEAFQQAKAMEKEQIKTAFIHGSYTGCGCYDYMEDEEANDYYENIFKNKL